MRTIGLRRGGRDVCGVDRRRFRHVRVRSDARKVCGGLRVVDRSLREGKEEKKAGKGGRANYNSSVILRSLT